MRVNKGGAEFFSNYRARLLQRLSEALWKEVHNRLQVDASNPEGPAAPLVLRAAERIVEP